MHTLRARALLLLGGGLLAAAGGCAKARPPIEEGRRCTDWKNDIGPLLAASCSRCHAGDTPAGNFRVSTYLDALGRHEGGENVIVAGNKSSRLLRALDPATATEPHRGFQDLLPKLEDWVVDCRAMYVRSSIHGAGLQNPDDPQFHGALIAQKGWNFGVCTKCHGEDFSGGTSGASCLTCHEGGPTKCGSCHGLPPANGAHLAHAGGPTLGKKLECGECHRTYKDWRDPGHVLAADGSVDPPPVEVVFGALAATQRPDVAPKGPPTFNHDTQRCDNVYCHGDYGDDRAASNRQPSWNAPGKGQAACGTCHGIPPSNHSSDRCGICHPSVANDARQIVNPSKHLDGVVDVGDGSGTCHACHGDETTKEAFRDLTGNTLPTALGVGAHAAHLRAGRLRGPVACAECHQVPDKVRAPGHIDSDLPAEVFPKVPGVATLASTGGGQPAWDRMRGTCADVYCHGGGQKFAADAAVGLHREPAWTRVGLGEAACGTCHGLPPKDGIHPPAMLLSDCVNCHPRSVDAAGTIVLTGAPGAETSTHINGVVDLGP
jgi:predicted CxxxxCH...CXXCH cytochrome family protein